MAQWLGFNTSTDTAELPQIFPLSVKQVDFISIDVVNIYTKILVDVIERTQGIKETDQKFLWDNCLASESNEGLVSMLAKAMSNKEELFLVIDRATEVLRKATNEEQLKIKEDYRKTAGSKVGAYISFRNYSRTDMIRLYAALEYCTIDGLSKSMSISTAVQMKMSDLRASTAATDSAETKAQAKAMANALLEGRAILMDAKDLVETAKPDLSATNAAMDFLNQKRCFYLGMPASYITGVQTKGMYDTGMAEAKATERGLKNYYFSIIKPVIKALFGSETKFKSEDFQQLESALEAIKTFELTSAQYMTDENKLKVINNLFGFPEDTEGGPVEETPQPVPGAAPVPGQGKPAPPEKAPPK